MVAASSDGRFCESHWQAKAELLSAEVDRLKEAFEYHRNESARKGVRITELCGQIEALKAVVAQHEMTIARDGSGNAKGFNTLLRLFGGIAMAVYGFNPDLPRSTVVSDIQNDLDLKGINVDADTIRKRLKEVAKLLKAAENRNAKPK